MKIIKNNFKKSNKFFGLALMKKIYILHNGFYALALDSE